jgi:hypothetical protein
LEGDKKNGEEAKNTTNARHEADHVKVFIGFGHFDFESSSGRGHSEVSAVS